MATSAGTTVTTTRKLNREELGDAVDVTQRSDTPIYSMIENDKATSVMPEWGVKTFDVPGANAQSEGRDYSFSVSAPAVRYANHVQILEKSGKFSGTQEAVDNAGRAEQLMRDKVEKALALKTDVEFCMADPTVASTGAGDRRSGGLATWATTNVTRGVGGANGGFNPATKVTAVPTNGTQRAFTKTLLDDLLQSAYSSGAKLRHMFFAPYPKRVFAGFMSDATVAPFRYAAKESENSKNTLVADAEVYLGPLGTVFAHPNFVMGASAAVARNVFILDTTKIKWAWLRKISEDKGIAKTGDYERFVLQGEGTLKPSNEKAIGVIADIFGMTSTT